MEDLAEQSKNKSENEPKMIEMKKKMIERQVSQLTVFFPLVLNREDSP